jgi:WD40 repeat protein
MVHDRFITETPRCSNYDNRRFHKWYRHRRGFAAVATLVEVLLGTFVVGCAMFSIAVVLNSAQTAFAPALAPPVKPVFNLWALADGRHLWLQHGQSEISVLDLESLVMTPVIQPNRVPLIDSCVSRDGETRMFAVENFDVLIFRREELIVAEPSPLDQIAAVAPSWIALSGDGSTAVHMRSGKTVRRWNLSDAEPVASTFELTEPAEQITLDFSGERLLISSAEGIVSLHDATTGRRLLTFAGRGPLTADAAFGDDGSRLAVVRGSSVVLYNVNSPNPEWTFEGADREEFRFVAMSPDGNWVAANGRHFGIQLIDTATGKLHRTIFDPSHVRRLSFSPSSQELYCGCNDGTVRVWSPSDGHEIQQIKPFEKSKSPVA